MTVYGLDSLVSRGRVTRARRSAPAFTLVELLVVVAIISILIVVLLPSLRISIRQARATVCKVNLKELYLSVEMYRGDNRGWLPVGSENSDLRSSTTWTIPMFADDPSGRESLVCPDDPLASVLRNSLRKPDADLASCSSYGMNDFIVSSPDNFLADLGRRQPGRPSDTILLADMGPDQLTTIQNGNGDVVLEGPVRNYARLAVADGYAPGEDGVPWLTGRHMNRINVLTLVGNVKSINTLPALTRQIESYYPSCAAQSCTLCRPEFELEHYSFAESSAFWWTGPLLVP